HLLAQKALMRRRIVVAAVFAVCMAIMVSLLFAAGSLHSEGTGAMFIALGPIFPAFAMLLMFTSMTASANRFYAKFAPRLGQIDHEIMAFGVAALAKRYQGSLFVFDLAGMKALNELRMIDDRIEA